MDWFRLEFVRGRIYPNPDLTTEQRLAVQKTIERIGLDDAGNRKMRACHYQENRENLYNADFLKKRSPFVWQEAQRQKLL